MDQTMCEDLKAFEKRLTEILAAYHPSTVRWRFILIALLINAVVGVWYWSNVIKTTLIPLLQEYAVNYTLRTCIVATATFIPAAIMLTYVCRNAFATRIIVVRMQGVLEDFNMNCDEEGKLILRVIPSNSRDKVKKLDAVSSCDEVVGVVR